MGLHPDWKLPTVLLSLASFVIGSCAVPIGLEAFRQRASARQSQSKSPAVTQNYNGPAQVINNLGTTRQSAPTFTNPITDTPTPKPKVTDLSIEMPEIYSMLNQHQYKASRAKINQLLADHPGNAALLALNHSAFAEEYIYQRKHLNAGEWSAWESTLVSLRALPKKKGYQLLPELDKMVSFVNSRS